MSKSKKLNNPVLKDLIVALMCLFEEIIGYIGRGLFFGLGFWWAFHILMK